MSETRADQQIVAFLAGCTTASLATVGMDNSPFAANVQFVSDDAGCLYWVSSVSSAHSVNLAANPQAAVTIYAHADSPESIHGLQLRGEAVVLDGENAEQALALYTEKYPFTADPPYRDAVLSQRFYRFTPSWLRWIDNRRGFGWKREIDF